MQPIDLLQLIHGMKRHPFSLMKQMRKIVHLTDRIGVPAVDRDTQFFIMIAERQFQDEPFQQDRSQIGFCVDTDAGMFLQIQKDRNVLDMQETVFDPLQSLIDLFIPCLRPFDPFADLFPSQ